MFQLKKFISAFALTSAVFLSACSELPFTSAEPISNAAAHWLSKDTLVIKLENDVNKVVLTSENRLGDITRINLKAKTLSKSEQQQYPHLAAFQAYEPVGEFKLSDIIKSHNIIESYSKNNVVAESYVQQGSLLDSLFTQGANDADEVSDYGATITSEGIQFKIWAPTAVDVSVILYDQNKSELAAPIKLTENKQSGIWQATTSVAKPGTYYRYQVEVFHPRTRKFETLVTTDPYSLSLSTNSEYSQVVDLTDSSTMPSGWQQHTIPVVDAPEDLILYETHIRDFSAFDSKLSDANYRGKYKAFSEQTSSGMKHLMMLKAAGLNTVHLLPTYDLSTINEDPEQAIDLTDAMDKVCELVPLPLHCERTDLAQLTLQDLLNSFDPSGADAQQVMELVRGQDNYNWGYDPFHYTVPEGSYAVNPDGISRIVEFREMVQSLHEKGFRVIMDVVYNHTFASGIAEKSVLDKVVPNYYHRYNSVSGALETSTCCDNTATERTMMAKLMTDSLVTWAQHYRIDGFRFDLMGHQPKEAMLKARKAVQKVDPDTYFYGEGWNFGEVANNRRFVQATQTELAGTEIGTFTDRLRDAIRGGNFQTAQQGLRHDQGLGNGLTVIPNNLQDEKRQVNEYELSMMQAKLGLVANLASYSMIDTRGDTVTGADIKYGGGPAGYALDPADTINYVSKHDNQTLWDNNQYRLPHHFNAEQRVRAQLLSLSYPLLAQGIPFLHMGSELLRSKSFLRDSYDYGDWFNKVDFSYQSNNYDVGLPPEQKDGANWPTISAVLAGNEGRDKVTPTLIKRSAHTFADFIKIRSGSKLFRLRNAEQIQHQVTFLNSDILTQKGLIVMHINDNGLTELDPNFESIVVVFNNDDQAQVFATDASDYELHPVQANGADELIKQATATEAGFSVPALSTAVFVNPQ